MKSVMSSKVSLVLFAILVIVVSGGHAKADFVFGEPTNLGAPVNSTNYDAGPSISSDGLSLFFYSLRSGGFGGSGWEPLDLWVSTREMTTDDWGTPTVLGSPVNSSAMDGTPCISSDGLSLFFDSWRSGGSGQSDIWMTTRATIYDPWGTPVNLGTMVNSSASDIGSCISADGLELFFGSDRTGGSGDWDIWVTTRATVSDPWGLAENLGPTVNSPVYDGLPAISPDGLLLFFTSLRSGGYGDNDIWVAKRATRGGEWGEPVNLGPMVNTSAGEAEPSISYNGRWLYFDDYTIMRPGGIGGPDLWKVPILPIVDFNADGIVDSIDMCVIVNHWGEDYSLCDIGPMPWGDGIVDVQDLIVLSEHLFEEASNPKLIAHWKFDEIDGMYSADSVGENDAIVMGGIECQPAGGQIDGALKFDGVSGCAIVGTFLYPADGPFSVLAWVKDCAPGQVILSQQNVSNWLAIDSDGNLITDLKSSDPAAGSLISETIITDGQWHRVGVVWDGSHRTLIVDGVTVAEDTQPGLESSQMGFYIGVDKFYAPGTFFSGLIDDLRVYNRVVSP